MEKKTKKSKTVTGTDSKYDLSPVGKNAEYLNDPEKQMFNEIPMGEIKVYGRGFTLREIANRKKSS